MATQAVSRLVGVDRIGRMTVTLTMVPSRCGWFSQVLDYELVMVNDRGVQTDRRTVSREEAADYRRLFARRARRFDAANLPTPLEAQARLGAAVLNLQIRGNDADRQEALDAAAALAEVEARLLLGTAK